MEKKLGGTVRCILNRRHCAIIISIKTIAIFDAIIVILIEHEIGMVDGEIGKSRNSKRNTSQFLLRFSSKKCVEKSTEYFFQGFLIVYLNGMICVVTPTPGWLGRMEQSGFDG